MALKNVIKYVKNPEIIFFGLARKGWVNWIPDKAFLEIAYRLAMKKKLNLQDPQTFNEKLQWLKLHDRKPIYTTMVYKYEANQYVAERICKEYVIPTYGVWDTFDEIDFDTLPDQFVLKCTHDCGGLVICKDKSKFDIQAARDKMNKHLRRNYYFSRREWPYKDVKPRIIAEKYMQDSETNELRDYKFFCFSGEVKFLKIDFNRFTYHQANYYTPDGQILPFGETVYPPDFTKEISMPRSLEKMVEFAEILSQGKAFLRVDFYEVDGKIYFGELTFYPNSGLGTFTSEEWDQVLGEWLHLPQHEE